MDCSMPGFPVLHCLEFTQTHAHWVSDAIQPIYSLPPPSPALNLSQEPGKPPPDIWNQIILCCWDSPVHHRMFSRIPGLDPLQMSPVTANCGLESRITPMENHWTWAGALGSLPSFLEENVFRETAVHALWRERLVKTTGWETEGQERKCRDAGGNRWQGSRLAGTSQGRKPQLTCN